MAVDNTLFGLGGKVVVVTGAAQGIGRACATMFAETGARLVLADLQEAKARDLAAELREAGTEAVAVGVDIRRHDDIGRLVAATVEAFGSLDIAVNNAGGDLGYVPDDGTTLEKSIFDVTPDYFDASIELNLKATLFCCQAFARTMVERGRGGSIVNITSFQGFRASPGMPVYGAAKAAVAHLTATLAYELGPHGIRVNAVAPSFIETDRTADLSPQRKMASLAAMPLGRVGQTRDLAASVVFLASPLASYYTGQHIAADGGLSLTSARPPSLWTARERPPTIEARV